MSEPSSRDLLGLLRDRFGFASFRPGQEEAIRALLEDRRVLSIQPTGYGKSLLYQLPSILLEGMTLVVSPLLALVRDQIGHLTGRFGIPAASINTDQTDEENDRARGLAAQGSLRILFIAPEQLDNLETRAMVSRLPVDLFVVDEAHCISTWGHDFRPSYRQIVEAVRELEGRRPGLRVLGLTATADRRTEEDIARQLAQEGGAKLRVLRSSMDRPNIALAVRRVQGFGEKLAYLASQLRCWQGSGILYCATRENTETVADYLRDQGLDVVSYHAGYEPERKRALQDAFIQGRFRAIAATNALGMGIDKPDVRFIVHVDVPGSITAYYQEVGRAGRDGAPATGVLLFDPADSRIQEHFIRSAQPTPEDFDAVLGTIVPDAEGLGPSLNAVRVRSGLHPTKVTVILAELAEQGIVEKRLAGRRQVYERTGVSTAPDLGRYERQNRVRTRELDAMLHYGRGGVDCLMHALRAALGDEESSACGRCSLCAGSPGDLAGGDVGSPGDLAGGDVGSPGDLAGGGAGSPVRLAGRDAGVAERWLADRAVPIPRSARPAMSEGLALMGSERRAPAFIQFMRHRASPEHPRLSEELEALLLRKLDALAAGRRFGAVLPLPSRTWAQRETAARLVASRLGAELHPDLLDWKVPPERRQGELSNNDQRRENVHGKLAAARPLDLGEGLAVLLLDDYTGSGATLKEAARALRAEGGLKGEIVPMALAQVRWRLGASGMV